VSMNPRTLVARGICVLLASAPLSAFGGEFFHKTFSAKAYSGSRERQYQVFVPSAYSGQAVPLVMVLHGCKQTEQNMINETRFKELAERENFIVVYPFITSYDGTRSPNCWGFWFAQHIHEGAGEVEDLYGIAREVEAQFAIDPQRRYVTGLSSGAGMSVALAVARSEYFAAAGAEAGLPYAETSSSVGFVCANPGTFQATSAAVEAMRKEQKNAADRRVIPIMTIHSRNDCTVNAKASEIIRDAWLRRYGLSEAAVATLDCSQEGVACTQKKYGSARRSVVETVFYDGARGDFLGNGSHYWVGDNAGEFANPNGPSAAQLFWEFFKSHSFSENQAPTVAIAAASASGTSITISGTARDVDGSIARVEVQLAGRNPVPPILATGTATWSATFSGVPDNSVYVPTAHAIDDKGATANATGSPIQVGTPPPNQLPSISIESASADGTCITLAGAASDSDGSVASAEAKLGDRGFQAASLSGGRFRYQECGLPAGVYSTQARATDNLGAQRTVSGASVKVSGIETSIATWLEHMNANRIRTYGAPCQPGFGACDLGFQSIFLTHSFNPFPLHRLPSSDNWYADPGNIRSAPVERASTPGAVAPHSAAARAPSAASSAR